MATLYAFYNFTPDSDNGIYYFPKQAENDLFRANNKLLNQFKADAGTGNYVFYKPNTFKVYEEYIDLPEIGSRNAINITYVAIETDNTIIFYFVNSIKPIPQGYRLYTAIDYWATYISIANITKVRFTRSNALINANFADIYLADEIPTGNKARRHFFGFGNVVTQDEVRFIAIIELEESTTVSGTISRTVPFLFNPFEQPYIAELIGSNKELQIYGAIEAIQNIYQTTVGGGKAHIKKLYIIPASTASYLSTFKSKLYGQDITIQGLNISSYCKIYKENYNFINTTEFSAPEFEQAYPNAKKFKIIGGDIYAGAKYNALKLPSFVGGYGLRIWFDLKQDELKASITNGDESRDISDSFELPATANTGTLTSLERIAKGLNLMTNLAGGVFQIAAGGAGLVSGTAQIGSTLTNLNEHRNGAYIPAGNGRNTFANIVKNGGSDYLYFIDAPELLMNNTRGQKQIKTYGAMCNIEWADADENLLNFASSLDTYLAGVSGESNQLFIACTVTVDDIPNEAAQTISDILNTGARIKFIND